MGSAGCFWCEIRYLDELLLLPVNRGFFTVRFFWFFLTLLTLSTWQLPAWAGKLVSWEFNDQRRQLQFRTDERVQPQAQLIPDPSRLVIDLPGTVLGRASVNRTYGGKITAVRVGQFAPNVARLVIELAPGYTLDPNGIKFEGRSPTNWIVDLPEPQPIVTSSTPQPITDEQIGAATSVAEDGFLNDQIQVTQGGFFIALNQSGRGNIPSERKGDRLEFTLKNIKLPTALVNQTVTLNRYRVQNIEFRQTSATEARISLKLDRNSPEWRALYSTYAGGGLVLIPNGGTNNLEPRDVSPVPIPEQVVETQPQARPSLAVVEAVDLINNGTQLTIQGNNRLIARGSWNRNEGVYQVRIENAQLAQPVRGPQMDVNSPVSRISMRQETESTVLVQIEPALGVQIGELNQPGDRLLSLALNRLRNPNVPTNNTLTVPPAQNFPTTSTTPSTFNPPQTNILVMIDPGHGGKDPGAIGIGGLQEKNVILPISQEVAQILQQNGIGVQLTRDSDYFVSLEGRTQMANSAKATLFVSIHANAISMSRPEVNGLEVYYHQSGKGLAEAIHRSILNRISMRDRGVRTARFYVLRNTSMPSALVEVGFVTGREDAPNLSNPAYRSQMAQAIASGILDYIQSNYR